MKKWIALLLSLAMLLSLAACAGGMDTTSPDASKDTKDTAAEVSQDGGTGTAAPVSELPTLEQQTDSEIGGYKIGFYYLPDSDPLSAQYHRALDYVAEITNCEMVYYDASTLVADELSTAVESLTASGCDGIIMVSGNSPTVFEYMNDKGVYYAGLSRSYTDEVAAVTDDSEYCCGWGDEGTGVNFSFGYEPVAALAEAGVKNVAFVGISPGTQNVDERFEGAMQAIEDYDLNLLTSFQGQDFAAGFADVLSAYGSELDGLIGHIWGEAGIAAIESAGYGGQIIYVQPDVPSKDTTEYFENDRLYATFAGNNAFIIQMYMQIFNALSDADRLFSTPENNMYPIIPAFCVVGADEWRQAEKYLQGDIPGMLPEDILALCSHYAPDTTVEEKEELMLSYTEDEYWNMETIVERISPYVD